MRLIMELELNHPDFIDVSVVSPVYGCAHCLPELVRRTITSLSNYGNIEIILVCDRSPDDSWQVIKRLAAEDSRVKGILLSKNVGQHHAISAGIKRATGKATVVLDCDLQDRPEDIQNLLKALREGNGIAVAKSSFRGKRGIRRNLARVLYFKVLDALTGTRKGNTHSTISFFALSAPARDAFNTYTERQRHVSAIVRDIGFSTKYVPIEHEEIINNSSSYSTRNRINLAFDGVILHGARVLKYAVVLSLLLFVVTFLALGFVIFAKITNSQSLPGWLSTIALLLLVVSIQFLTIGIVGIYLSEVLTEVRARPGYLIEETT